jgi:hypothetical protein
VRATARATGFDGNLPHALQHQAEMLAVASCHLPVRAGASERVKRPQTPDVVMLAEVLGDAGELGWGVG